MVSQVAVEKISHLLITTSKNGMSDSDTFKDACHEFDNYFSERLIVLLSDGHSSHISYDCLRHFFPNNFGYLFLVRILTT